MATIVSCIPTQMGSVMYLSYIKRLERCRCRDISSKVRRHFASGLSWLVVASLFNILSLLQQLIPVLLLLPKSLVLEHIPERNLRLQKSLRTVVFILITLATIVALFKYVC
jgi:hypothetical protein